jgi:hypothetical protein
MLAFKCADQNERERIIGRFVRPVANELRSLELHLLVAQVSTGRAGNLESIVEASSELYFKPGTLRCSQIAEIDLRWGAPPKVAIVLTFCAHGVVAAFLLQLDTFSSGVDLQYASFPEGLSPKQETKLLERVLKKSRRRWQSDQCGSQKLSLKGVDRRHRARPTQVFASKLE